MGSHESVEVFSLPPCDFCALHKVERVATVDGATEYGPWANMCEPHFEAHGLGLGLGTGQRLVLVKHYDVPLDEEEIVVGLDHKSPG